MEMVWSVVLMVHLVYWKTSLADLGILRDAAFLDPYESWNLLEMLGKSSKHIILSQMVESLKNHQLNKSK